MTQVSKGGLREFKIKSARLARAVPTLDLRRRQLTMELLAWEERLAEAKAERDALAACMETCPHPEIERIVSLEGVKTKEVSIAGVMLLELDTARISVKTYSLLMTPPSFDAFVEMKSRLIEETERVRIMERSLDLLSEELAVTTQRINLFEKRLIPRFQEGIRYIRGRLEDSERSSVIVAKIAQSRLLGEQAAFESA